MLDPYPRVIYVTGVGMFSIGTSHHASLIAGDLAETNARVIASVEETSKYQTIKEKDILIVVVLEQAKINKTKKSLQERLWL